MKIFSSVFLGLAVAVAGHAQTAWLDLAQRQSVRTVKLVEPVFPRSLLEQGVKEGYATIVLNVSDEGKLEDWFVSAYSHREFADASLEALKDWEFAPARLNGEPIGVVNEVQFSFEAGQVVIQMNVNDAFTVMLNRFVKTDGYRLSKLAEIDRIPVPRVVEAPLYTTDHVKKGQRGKVVLEFIIDETGRVRLPFAVSGEDRELTDLAWAALSRWQFEPPLRQGRPVAVRAQQVFNFDPKAVSSAAK